MLTVEWKLSEKTEINYGLMECFIFQIIYKALNIYRKIQDNPSCSKYELQITKLGNPKCWLKLVEVNKHVKNTT